MNNTTVAKGAMHFLKKGGGLQKRATSTHTNYVFNNFFITYLKNKTLGIYVSLYLASPYRRIILCAYKS